MNNFLARLVPKNIAAILGLVGVCIPLVRELVMVALRLAAVFVPKVEALIEPVGTMFDTLQANYDKIKNFLLGTGG